MRYLLCALALFVHQAAAQEDVGLVDLVAGDVAFQAGKAKAFMKVREGDRFEVPAGAQLRLIYFAGARQERWQGPARLSAGKRESTALSGKVAAVTLLPASVPQRLARIPELTQNALFGGVAVRGSRPRGGETEESLREARIRKYAQGAAHRRPDAGAVPLCRPRFGARSRQRRGQISRGAAARTSEKVKSLLRSGVCRDKVPRGVPRILLQSRYQKRG
jgi:hypothetical protein